MKVNKSIFSIHPSWAPDAQLPMADVMPTNMVREGKDRHDHLNDEQLATLSNLRGINAINAGAGTGKSTCLIAKLCLINERYPDAKILMISFTKKSALELRERISGNASNVSVSTFHSLAYHILVSTDAKFRVITNDAAIEAMIRKVIGNNSMTTVEAVRKSLQHEKDADKDTLTVRNKYLTQLKKQHIVTFDTMQIFALQALQTTPNLLSIWQQKYDFFLVDEFQDVDPHQLALIQLLSQRTGNLTVVGDARQSIYSFRGSVPRVMESFASANGVNAYDLTANYRCNPAILGLANQIMREYQPLTSAASGAIKPTYPHYLAASTPRDEAKVIVNEIQELHKAGHRYKDMTILYRSSTVSMAVISELLARKIPAVSQSATPLQALKMPYKGLVNLFRFILRPDDEETFKAIMPILFLRKSLFTTIKAVKNKKGLSWLDAVKQFDFPFFHKEYIDAISTGINLAATMLPKDAAICLLKNGYEKFAGKEYAEVLNDWADELAEYTSITSYLAHLDDLAEQIKAMRDLAATNDDYVTLMTIHASKGMEWKIVFLIGAYDGCLPSGRDDADLSEERRLLYVAVTRAEEKLYISYPRMSAGSRQPNTVCRFLAECFN